MDDLQIIDYEILEYIDKKGFALRSDLNTEFKLDCAERITRLIKNGYIAEEMTGFTEQKANDGSVIGGWPIFSGRLYVTDGKGKISLQNHIAKREKSKQAKCRENIRYAITTLIALAALINSILARLGQ